MRKVLSFIAVALFTVVAGAQSINGLYTSAMAGRQTLATLNDLQFTVAGLQSSVPYAQTSGRLIQLDSNAWITVCDGVEKIHTITWTPVSVPDYTQLVVQDFYGTLNNGGQTPAPGDVLTGAGISGPWSITYPDESIVTVQSDYGSWYLTTSTGDASGYVIADDPVIAGLFNDATDNNWQCDFTWVYNLVTIPVTNADTYITAGDITTLLGGYYTSAQVDGFISTATSLANQAEIDAQAAGSLAAVATNQAGSAAGALAIISNQLAYVQYGTNNFILQDFENYSSWTQSGSSPFNCWDTTGWTGTQVRVYTNSLRQGTPINSSGYSAWLLSTTGAFVMSPLLAGGVNTVYYDATCRQSNGYGSLILQSSTNQGATWQDIQTNAISYASVSSVAITVNATVPSLIRFYRPSIGGGGTADWIALDNIRIGFNSPVGLNSVYDVATAIGSVRFGSLSSQLVTPLVSTNTLTVKINGTTYKVLLGN